MAGGLEHSNEPSGSVKCKEILGCLRRKRSAVWSLLVGELVS